MLLPAPDGPTIAIGTNALMSAQHLAPIDRGPDGITLPPADACATDGMVWTGTAPGGTLHPDNCAGFSNGDSGTKGAAGRYSANDGSWSAECPIACATSLRLYCFQQ